MKEPETVLEHKLVRGFWLQVWKRDGTDGISWDELQSMKNRVFGKDATAIEIFPAEDQLVNLKNIRHLWLVPPDTQLPNLKTLLRL